MSLFLCIYSKSLNFEPEKFKSVFESFSLSGKRNIKSFNFPKASINIFQKNELYDSYSNNSDNTTLSIVSGMPYISSDINKEVSVAKYLLSNYSEKKQIDLSNIGGNFSAFLYNQNTHELTISTDRYGIFPLFYYESSDFVILCNEFEPIISCKHYKKEFNYDAVREYFELGSVFSNNTFFKNIYRLGPASTFLVKKESAIISIYNSNNINIDPVVDANYHAEKIFRILKKSVNGIFKIVKKPEFMLTGGLDTRFILSTLSPEQRNNITFHTYQTPGVSINKDGDICISKIISNELNLKHKCEENDLYSHRWQTKLDTNSLKVWRNVDANIQVGGLCGGEFIGGHFKKLLPIPNSKSFLNVLHFFSHNKSKNNCLLPTFLKNTLNPFITLNKITSSYNTNNLSLRLAIDILGKSTHSSLYNGYYGFWNTPGLFTQKLFLPFLNPDFLDTLLTIPPELLNDEKNGIYNSLYKKIIPTFSKFPTNSSIGLKEGTCINFFEEGTEARDHRAINYYSDFFNNISFEEINELNILNVKHIQSLKNKPLTNLNFKIIDFVLFYKSYFK